MGEFTLLADDIDVAALRLQLESHSDLWGQCDKRIVAANSPHRETQDIWIRYRHPDELNEPADYLGPHWSVWYPAAEALPAAKDLAFELMALVRGTHLGGILITRIPPGCQVYPHHDRGTWHSEQMNMKVWLPIQANAFCINRCEGEAVNMMPGEAWTFSNLKVHSVENRGQTDRICYIASMRTE